MVFLSYDRPPPISTGPHPLNLSNLRDLGGGVHGFLSYDRPPPISTGPHPLNLSNLRDLGGGVHCFWPKSGIYLTFQLFQIGSSYFGKLSHYAIYAYCWPLMVREIISEPSRTIYCFFDHTDPLLHSCRGTLDI
jgi:hypothetical protein